MSNNLTIQLAGNVQVLLKMLFLRCHGAKSVLCAMPINMFAKCAKNLMAGMAVTSRLPEMSPIEKKLNFVSSFSKCPHIDKRVVVSLLIDSLHRQRTMGLEVALESDKAQVRPWCIYRRVLERGFFLIFPLNYINRNNLDNTREKPYVMKSTDGLIVNFLRHY